MFDFTGVAAIAIPEGDVVKIENESGVLWQKASGIILNVSFSDADGATTRFLGELGTLTVGGVTITTPEQEIALSADTNEVTITYQLSKRISNRRTVAVNGTTIGQIQNAGSKVSTTISVSNGETITITMTS